MADDIEKPTPQTSSEKAEKSEHEDVEVVVPIQQEAFEDVYHVHLSWRSWVSIHAPLKRVRDPTTC